MKKSGIVGRLAGRMGLSRSAAESAVDTVLEAIAEALAKEEAVRLDGFGTFRTKSRAARSGRNPGTGESVQIEASKAPSFKAAKALRDAVNKGWEAVSADRAGDRNVRWRTHGKAGETLEVSEWPGGLAPVWSLLEPQSEEALRSEPSPENGALSFASDVEDEALAQSVFVRNALVLLEAMEGKETMWMSSSSNYLMKKCVTRLRGLISWPGLEATEHFRKGKTYREQDVGELHLLRLLVERAGLTRSAGLWFELTPLGRALLEPGRRGTLQALLFRHASWDMDLSRFVRVHPRGLPGWWPQGEIGVILWALSAVAEDWQNAGALTALCTIPDDELPVTRRGAASTMFVWRILWPLRWFGLFEYRGPEETRDVAWRKSVLFDRFLSFDVRLSDNRGSSH